MSEEEETAGQRVLGDWKIHHFSSAVRATWKAAAKGPKWQMSPGDLNSSAKEIIVMKFQMLRSADVD